MKSGWLVAILLAILLGAGIVYYFIHPKIVFTEKPITVVQFVPSKPDTIYIKKTIYKPSKPDTIYNTEIHVENQDTVISEILFTKDTAIGNVTSFIQAKSFCGVEKFSNDIVVDQTKFQDELKKEVERQTKKVNNWKAVALWTGGITVGVGGGVLLVEWIHHQFK